MAGFETRKIEVQFSTETTGDAQVATLVQQVEALAEQGGEAAPQFAALAAELRKIDQQQGLLSTFTKLKTETADAAAALEAAQRKAQALGRELAATEKPTYGLIAEFNRAKREVTGAKTALQESQLALQTVRGQMQQAGLSTRNLAQTQVQLKAAAADTAAEFLELQGFVGRARAVTQDYDDTASRAGAGVAALGANTADLGNRLDEAKSKLLAASAAVTAVGVILGSATEKSSEFGKSMAEVSTLLDDTSGMDQLTEHVRALSREFGGNVNANATALYEILSAGAGSATEAVDTLTAANKLAVGGVTEVKTAADGLTSVLNAYGTAAGSAASVADAFFVAALEGKTNIDELSNSIGQVAPIATTVGVSLDELLASISAITLGGVKTSEAVTQIRSAVSSVIKPTKEAAELADQLGLQFDAAAIKSKGLAGFLADVQAKTKGNAEQMAILFGNVEGLQGVLALTGTQAESFGNILDAMAQKAGATETAVAKMMETPAQRAARFKAALTDVQISLGDAVTAFSPLLEALTGTLNLFNSAPGPIKTMVAGIGAIGVAVPAVSIAVRNLSAAWTMVTGASLSAAPALTAAGRAAATSGAQAAAATPAVTGLAGAMGGRLLLAVRGLIGAVGPLGIAIAAIGGGAIYLVNKYNEVEMAALDAKLAIDKSFEAPADRVAPALDLVATKAEAARFKLAEVQTTFQALTADGATTAEALGKIAAAVDLSSVEGVAKLVTELQLLKDSAYATGEQIQTAIADRLAKLSGQDLHDFGIEAEMAFKRGSISAEQLASVMEGRTIAAARQLGVEVNLAADGMSAKFRDAAASLDVVVQSFDRIKTAGADAGLALEQSVAGALKAAASPKELEYLAEVVKQAGQNGQLSQQQITGMLDAIRTKADQVTPGINSVAEAFKTLGIVSQQDLQRTADNFKAAYEQIRNSGQATAAELQQAFVKYAQAAVAANGGVASDALKAEAAVRKVAIEADSAGRAVVQAMSDAKAATDALADSADQTAAKFGEIKREANFLHDANGNLIDPSKQAASASDGGGIITGYTERGAYDFAKQQGLTEAQALKVAADYMDQRNAADSLSRLKESIDKLVLDNARAAASAAQTAQDQESATSRRLQPNTTTTVHRVEIKLPSGSTTAINTASAGDADALTSLFDRLQADMARAM